MHITPLINLPRQVGNADPCLYQFNTFAGDAFANSESSPFDPDFAIEAQGERGLAKEFGCHAN